MQNHRGNIVIVEDDIGMNRAVVRLLTAAGFHSLPFDTAENLLESKTAAIADCFLLDIHLPGLSGFALHSMLEESGIHRPIIFMTADDDADSQHKACDTASCLMKPFVGRVLIAAIDAALLATRST
jgi:FixJ family two-component response regulator